MKLNFDQVEVYTDLSRNSVVEKNIRQDFANFIYTQCNGIQAHALALKIYNGNPETEYGPQEVDFIRICSQGCTPCVYDAIINMIARQGGIPMEVVK